MAGADSGLKSNALSAGLRTDYNVGKGGERKTTWKQMGATVP